MAKHFNALKAQKFLQRACQDLSVVCYIFVTSTRSPWEKPSLCPQWQNHHWSLGTASWAALTATHGLRQHMILPSARWTQLYLLRRSGEFGLSPLLLSGSTCIDFTGGERRVNIVCCYKAKQTQQTHLSSILTFILLPNTPTPTFN